MPSLASLVNQQAPPPNPQTPAQRTNPEHEWYVALQGIRYTVEDAQKHAEEYGDDVKAMLDAMRSACSAMLVPGAEPKAVAASMASIAVQHVAPSLAAQLRSLATNLSAPAMAPAGVGVTPGMPPMSNMPSAPPGMPGSPAGPGGATAGAPAPVSPASVAG
ncbi:MAG: hypothetical protein KGL39_32585 [Patescibacteria group bacterium]|nr:hypothetical protein [Patescibacteria group bacterium]